MLPFQLDSGIYLENIQTLVPWGTEIGSLAGFGSSVVTRKSNGVWTEWRGSKCLGGLVCKVEACQIMTKKRKTTSDAVQILHRRYYQGKPERLAALEEARAEDELARKIYELREQAGLTQARLARLVGTTPSVISRLEDSDYEGHSLMLLKRIAAAVNKRVEIRFVPNKGKLQPA